MAIIDIKKEHSLSKEEARLNAENIANELKKKIPLKHSWQSPDELHFSAQGAKGVIFVHETWMQIKIDLPPLLSFFKKTIETAVHQYMNSLPNKKEISLGECE